jgi:hypothetical protein
MKTLLLTLGLTLTLPVYAQTVVTVPVTPNSFTPTTVVTSQGTFVVVPNYSGGGVSAVIQVANPPAPSAPKK